MPRLFLDDLTMAPLAHYATGMLALISVLVLVLMWSRQKSALDLWIMVAICILISEMTLVTFVLTARFNLGSYVVRTLAVGVSTVVLIALLSEAMRLYAVLSQANTMLKLERENKLMNVQAATSSIVHEVRQPLTGITARASAARRWLEQVPPNVDTAKQLLDGIERSGFHANEILENISRLFQEQDHKLETVDMNTLILQTLQILNGELNTHSVKTDVDLTPKLPFVRGRRVQLQEVIINLVNNAIDAMAPIKVDRRALKVSTKIDGANAIVIEVEDAGQGIEPQRLGSIFEPFVTTKANGTGLGLAICSRIVEGHGGQLTASSDGKNGARLQVTLPVEPGV
jgi:signal transduction histidine kinase